ncbi:MAG: hypothetical protein ACLSG9_10575 [Eubacterium sp.]
MTEPETSGWNDIDPTAWIETDSKGVEHRYLAWGNGKLYVCELNEDMVSIKDLNGDGKITATEKDTNGDECGCRFTNCVVISSVRESPTSRTARHLGSTVAKDANGELLAASIISSTLMRVLKKVVGYRVFNLSNT